MADRKVSVTATERRATPASFSSPRSDAEEARMEAIAICDRGVRALIETARDLSAVRAKLVAENVRSSAAALREAA